MNFLGFLPTIPYRRNKQRDLPRNLTSLSVAVSSTRTRIAARDNLIGKITINFKDLPDCQEYDQWHQLTPRAKGSLRVAAIFNHEVILPTREYSSLKEILLKDNLDVLESLVKVCKEHHAELASRLVHIFLDTDMIIDKLIICNQRVIDKETNKGTLFRASSLATMLMDQYMKLKCLRYLHIILSGVIREVQESTDSCELDPTMMDKEDCKEKNVERLQYYITTTVNLILNTAADCPPPLRHVFHHLQNDVNKKWPDDNTCKTRAVGGFLFLRLICPALLKPQLFNLTTDTLSPNAERTLKLLAKYLQNLANQVEFKAKEQYMVVLNENLMGNMARMKKFIDNLSSISDRPEPPTYISYEPGRDLAFVYRICVKYQEELKKHKENVHILLTAMQEIKKAEERYLRKTL